MSNPILVTLGTTVHVPYGAEEALDACDVWVVVRPDLVVRTHLSEEHGRYPDDDEVSTLERMGDSFTAMHLPHDCPGNDEWPHLVWDE